MNGLRRKKKRKEKNSWSYVNHKFRTKTDKWNSPIYKLATRHKSKGRSESKISPVTFFSGSSEVYIGRLEHRRHLTNNTHQKGKSESKIYPVTPFCQHWRTPYIGRPGHRRHLHPLTRPALLPSCLFSPRLRRECQAGAPKCFIDKGTSYGRCCGAFSGVDMLPTARVRTRGYTGGYCAVHNMARGFTRIVWRLVAERGTREQIDESFSYSYYFSPCIT